MHDPVGYPLHICADRVSGHANYFFGSDRLKSRAAFSTFLRIAPSPYASEPPAPIRSSFHDHAGNAGDLKRPGVVTFAKPHPHVPSSLASCSILTRFATPPWDRLSPPAAPETKSPASQLR